MESSHKIESNICYFFIRSCYDPVGMHFVNTASRIYNRAANGNFMSLDESLDDYLRSFGAYADKKFYQWQEIYCHCDKNFNFHKDDGPAMIHLKDPSIDCWFKRGECIQWSIEPWCMERGIDWQNPTPEDVAMIRMKWYVD